MAYQVKLIGEKKVMFLFRYYLLPEFRRSFINHKVFLYFIEFCRNIGIDMIKAGRGGEIEPNKRTSEQTLTYNFLEKLKKKNTIKQSHINLKESTITFS